MQPQRAHLHSGLIPKAMRGEWKCPGCGIGFVRPWAEPGREDIPSYVEVPTCDNCGDMWIDLEAAAEITLAQATERIAELASLDQKKK